MASSDSSDTAGISTPPAGGSPTLSAYLSTYNRQYNVTPTPEREIPRIVNDLGSIDLGGNGDMDDVDPDDPSNSSASGRVPTHDGSSENAHRSTYNRQYNVTPTPERQLPSIEYNTENLNLSDSESASEAGSIHKSVSSGSARSQTSGASTLNAHRSTYSRQFNVTPTPERQIVDDLENLDLSGDRSINDEAEPNQNYHDDDDLEYNLRTESLPDVPIYDTRLQNALRDTKEQLRELHEAMEFGPGILNQAPNLSILAQQTNQLADFAYPETRTIGLVGDSGVGKSSLINSLLDERGVARSSGDGGACTNIVTEYRYPRSPDAPSYSFEVQYMSSEELKVLLEDLVSSYRAYNTEAFREIINQAERDAVKDKAERAASALNSLFGEHARYSEENLSREGQDAAAQIVRDLESMVEEVQQDRPGGPTASTWSATASDAEDLTRQLDVFIRVRGQDGLPVLWPFVGIIRVYLRSLFLRSGVVLADLPGLRDLNYARVRATDRYMRDCHEIFAVARIDRVTTDVGLRDIVNRCGDQRPLRIVCTRSEDVNGSETIASQPASAPRIKALKLRIDHLKRTLNRLRRDRRQRTGNAEEILTVGDELDLARFRLQEFLVQGRNDRVRASLHETYSDRVFERDLRIFCVSNVEYSEYRNEDVTLGGPHVNLSGIPELRQYCQLIPAAAQFGAVAAFLEHQVPSLLGSIRQWLLQGTDGLTAERADALRAALDSSRDRLSGWNAVVDALKRNLKSDFRASIVNSFDQDSANWSSAARNVSGQWMGWHWASFAAFCRNYGDYQTPAAGYHNWNDDIVLAMREDLEPDWTDLIQQASEMIDATFERISEMFEREEDALNNCLELAPNALGNLIENLGPKRDCIEDMLETASENFVEQIERIQSNALNGYPSSYITDKMRLTYLDCQSESGTGSDRRRKDHMRQKLSGTTLFSKLKRTVKDAQWEVIDEAVENIRTGLQREFDSLLRDIQSIVGEEGEVSESQRHPDTARRTGLLVEHLAQDLDDRHRLIEELRGHPSLR
ncbi:uncharacterized protein BDZ99DRAFT_528183 [Mytilinidion resinicola]|uniref:P-loop containing nucleoside triphosphate hydrolase protein n=1 Tax=Mytilinidion resinicola TaxID=574789 RepID=A0A6A6XYT0_9PEZI|nr:uncharacterized protein BDZ99DRAFT_528183 [Mytilinidion resinicola]KAF2801711.1 hypothetical protein BDZ99DRAFT_528183 [Mytilinidion resinicola]